MPDPNFVIPYTFIAFDPGGHCSRVFAPAAP